MGRIGKYLFPHKYLGGSGRSEDGSDEILEFDYLTGQWKLVDWMIRSRVDHAVSVILCSNKMEMMMPALPAWYF